MEFLRVLEMLVSEVVAKYCSVDWNPLRLLIVNATSTIPRGTNTN